MGKIWRNIKFRIRYSLRAASLRAPIGKLKAYFGRLKASIFAINRALRQYCSMQNMLQIGNESFSWSKGDNSVRLRLTILMLAFFLGFFALSLRLVYVSVTPHFAKLQSEISKTRARPDIHDRNGNLLAVNVPSSSLFANPSKVIEPELSAKKLKKIFKDINYEKLLSQLSSDKKFIWVKRDLSPREQQQAYNLGLPGFEFENEHKRIYTYGRLLSHVIGFVTRDLEGASGIEKFLDKQKEDGKRNASVNSVELSIDLRLQNILSEEMDKTIKKFNAKGGSGIIVDPNTGEILAMCSKPDFDPHFPGKADASALFNTTTLGTYEMGSGMKALTLAIGFDTKTISMKDAYNLSYMKVSGWQIKDHKPFKGWSSVPEIFLKSSNVGVSQIMLEIGRDKLQQYLKKLKLLDRLELEIPENGLPLAQSFNKWTDLSLVTMSYGYAISVSPAHFIQSMLPVVNGGIMHPLTLIKKKENKDIQTKSINPALANKQKKQIDKGRIFSQETSAKMRKLLRLVVSDGTGRKAEVDGYYIGGKTGTAEKVVNGRYNKKKNRSSFFGIMPATNPKYLIYIIFDEPQGIKETFGFSSGGWVAAPAAKNIFKRIISLYNISKIDKNDPDILELQDINYKIDNDS